MKKPRRKSAEVRRTLWALAFAYLFALQSLVSAVAFSCPASDRSTAFEAALASAICAHADDGQASASDKHAPAPVHSHHCLLCAAHAGCAAGVAASAHAFVPAREPIGRALAVATTSGLNPQAGRTSSWSARAPPFNA
ncbi:MAG: DUF2946 family protein [Roseiarcus sp.]|jgi:hypothetical protein